MIKVFIDITISLDGFAAGPDVSAENPMGIGGQKLHAWLVEGEGAEARTEQDHAAAQAMFANTGAFVLGRRTFEVGEPHWGEDGAFGKPCFVVTSRDRSPLIKGPTSFSFISIGIAAAVAAARLSAGNRDVCIMGGPTVARQALTMGLVNELRLHLAPVVLSSGTRLFDDAGPLCRFDSLGATQTDLATHLQYRIPATGSQGR
jgi:dihydrofolate reductase